MGQTDRRTELVKQYRDLHTLHADAR